ncbi:hypothetical protein E2562_038926 [Oryza meyeriana var. granulata]|uniref:FORGETTER1 second zinc ribbon domain-containing protein n=1 Tax=Oryza meyeriana var. granulata TaxID=110450 RepID=A0A6G1DTF1_9ORYZ|nr:hypothetical protein E2562_038926 [Oryza meyeriana var. granulata]
MTEFICPKCRMGVDPTKIQLPCTLCKAILNVPHGLARFHCPQCDVDLVVDLSKLRNFLSSATSTADAVCPTATHALPPDDATRSVPMP